MNKSFLQIGKRPLLSLLLLLFVVTTFAQVGQGSIKFSNPKPMGFTSMYASFADNTNGICVGNVGAIGKTTDAGATWQYGVFSYLDVTGMEVRPTFADVHFVTSNVAYAVGTAGAMAKSVDGGINWTLVKNPLYNVNLDINAVWFINKDTGYIGGKAIKTATSTATGINITTNETDPDAAPKLYFTKNGGTTWDSIAAPTGAKTMMGYVNNPTYAPIKKAISAWGKEIFRIRFVNATTGYVVGSTNTVYERIQSSATATTTNSGNWAALVWKFDNGSLIDYSVSKEKLGYTGILPSGGTLTATTAYSPNSTPAGQYLKAFTPINDSVIVAATFNNGMVVKISTGKSQTSASTVETGVNYPGKFEIVYNQQPPNGYPKVPITSDPFPGSNMVSMRYTPSGSIVCTSGAGRLVYSKDQGTSWGYTYPFPTSTNYTNAQLYALDVTPNGRIVAFGDQGVYADSLPNAASWKSTYVTATPATGASQISFLDCNNGITAGGFGLIMSTTDGGKTWNDKTNQAWKASLLSIYGIAAADNKFFFTLSNGNIYSTSDVAATNDLIFNSPIATTLNGIAAVGKRIWAVGIRYGEPVYKAVLFRSLDGGTTWDTTKTAFPTGTPAPNLQYIQFANQDTGYVVGTKGKVFRTFNGGDTWTDISPAGSPATGSISSLGVSSTNAKVAYFYVSAYPNKYLYKTMDAGATWKDVSPNLPTLAWGNITSQVIHDANNAYFVSGNTVLKTNDGGVTYTWEHIPNSGIVNGATFYPAVVPAGTTMDQRKVFFAGGSIYEMGTATKAYITGATEVIAPATCANALGGSIIVTPAGGLPPFSYKANAGAYQSSSTLTGLAQGNTTYTVTDKGCNVFTKTVAIPVTVPPTISAGPNVTVMEGSGAYIEAAVPPGTISWSPSSSLSNATIARPFATPTATTNYTITLTDANGCKATSSMLFTVLPYCVKPMLAFSPNGDGTNDKWLVTLPGNNCAGNINAVVFNRYGEVVYTNPSYQNNWDGTYHGKILPDGTYYYNLVYQLINGKTVKISGDVTIIR
jgi:gliding motility-associated-like protein